MKKLILLLNMGGPNNLDEVEIFLKNMFKDPNILNIKSDFLRSNLANLITYFRKKDAIENYKKIGNKSPIVEITTKLVEEIKKISEFDIDFAMRYTPPFAIDILDKYKDYDEIILFPLYPHYSKTTTLSSLQDARVAIERLKINAEIKIVDFFYELDEYNEIILELIKEKIGNLTYNEISDTTLIFSAHSLPKKMIRNGDIYEKQINSHVEILKNKIKDAKINFKDIKLAYQSKIGPIEWLGPNLSEVLPNLEIKKALIFPLSFCIDNSETDFELDLYYRNVAINNGFEYYEVCKCPNDAYKFAKFITDICLKKSF